MLDELKNLIFITLLFTLSCTPNSFQLRNGDLLFSVGKENSEFVNAIKNSTSAGKEIPFSHVGIAEIRADSAFVIEASSPDGVVRTPIADFLAKAASENGKTYIAVGRLKPRYRYAIPQALKNAKTLLGKGYDYAYDEDNNTYYCSELVRFSFRDSTGNYLFTPLAMSFKNKETGETELFWIEHYRKLGIPIPEGKPGTNPADMSKSKIINIEKIFY